MNDFCKVAMEKAANWRLFFIFASNKQIMAVNWKEYELVLKASDSKTCEVTGREMGDTVIHVCPVSKMKKDKQVVWEPSYGGYDTVKVTFIDTDDEAIHINIYQHYNRETSLKPGEIWRDSWWSGEWGYHVEIMLRKKESHRII